jgi:hypothetical protein
VSFTIVTSFYTFDEIEALICLQNVLSLLETSYDLILFTSSKVWNDFLKNYVTTSSKKNVFVFQKEISDFYVRRLNLNNGITDEFCHIHESLNFCKDASESNVFLTNKYIIFCNLLQLSELDKCFTLLSKYTNESKNAILFNKYPFCHYDTLVNKINYLPIVDFGTHSTEHIDTDILVFKKDTHTLSWYTMYYYKLLQKLSNLNKNVGSPSILFNTFYVLFEDKFDLISLN